MQVLNTRWMRRLCRMPSMWVAPGPRSPDGKSDGLGSEKKARSRFSRTRPCPSDPVGTSKIGPATPMGAALSGPISGPSNFGPTMNNPQKRHPVRILVNFPPGHPKNNSGLSYGYGAPGRNFTAHHPSTTVDGQHQQVGDEDGEAHSDSGVGAGARDRRHRRLPHDLARGGGRAASVRFLTIIPIS